MRTALLFLLVLFPVVAFAGWSPDPAVNTAISVKPDYQVQPKVAPMSDGGWYVSWFDNDPSSNPAYGYDVFLQRLDANGNVLWTENGIRIADRGLDWTTDYDLVVDAADNAVLAYHDMIGGRNTLFVTKISPSGTPLWITDVSRPETDNLTPKLVLLPDGRIVTAFQAQDPVDVVEVVSLTPNGAIEWRQGIVSPPYRYYLVADVAASDAGSVIVSFTFNGMSTNVDNVTYLLANKFDANGQRQWGEVGAMVYNAGFLEMAQFPRVVSDGHGGGIFVFRTIFPRADIYAQRITAGGLKAWTPKGVPVSLEPTYTRAVPSFTFDPATGETTVFFLDVRGVGAIYGQKLDFRGNRLWGDGGVIVRDFNPNYPGSVQSARDGNEFVVYWGEAPEGWPPDSDLVGARVAADGSLVCAPFVVAKTEPYGYLTMSMDRGGTSVLAWMDVRNDEGDIFAQNVNRDCTLGPRK